MDTAVYVSRRTPERHSDSALLIAMRPEVDVYTKEARLLGNFAVGTISRTAAASASFCSAACLSPLDLALTLTLTPAWAERPGPAKCPLALTRSIKLFEVKEKPRWHRHAHKTMHNGVEKQKIMFTVNYLRMQQKGFQLTNTI
jgi:hypothetical protein